MLLGVGTSAPSRRFYLAGRTDRRPPSGAPKAAFLELTPAKSRNRQQIRAVSSSGLESVFGMC